MKSINEFLSDLNRQEVKLQIEGGSLRYKAPQGKLTPALKAEIAKRKADIIAFLDDAEDTSYLHIPSVSRDQELPLSFAQQRLWFLNQLEPDNSAYNMPGVIRLRGQLNTMVIEETFNEIMRRHEILRTNFTSRNGQAAQIIHQSVNWTMTRIDLHLLSTGEQEKEIQQLAIVEANKPFALSTDSLIRATLILVSEAEHILLLTMHHIISDGWSIEILIQEIDSIYSALVNGQPSPLPEVVIQYVDFAVWQKQWLQGAVLERQIGYWQQQLAGAPALIEIPTDHPRPAIQTVNGAFYESVVSVQVMEAIQQITREEGVTLFMTLLTAFDTLLYRYTGQSDISVGSPIANRNHAEIENIIGFFANTLVLRNNLAGNPTFRKLLHRVKGVAMDAYAHQDLPFEVLVETIKPERNLSYSPLFQVMFVLQNTPISELELPQLTLSQVKIQGSESHSKTAKFDITLSVEQGVTGLNCQWEYNTDLFDVLTIKRMHDHFNKLLESIATNPDMEINCLPYLTTAELRQLKQFSHSDSSTLKNDQCLHELFEKHVSATPSQIAVICGEESISYRELNRRANQLAYHLRSLGVTPGVLVGICLERSIELIVSMVAIIKLGGVYVPLDPAYPKERLALMLTDTQLSIVLTQSELLVQLPILQVTTICLSRDQELISSAPDVNPSITVNANSLAYIIYTSGSTGVPKGVMISQQGIMRLVINTDYIRFTVSDRVAQVSNTAFDAATFEIWGALLNGSQLNVIPHEVLLSPTNLATVLKEQKITILFLTTALFNQMASLLPTAFNELKYLLMGGEACSPEASRIVLADGSPDYLIHVYGPTENTTFTTWYPVSSVPEMATNIPIGRPIQQTEVYILDENLQQVSIGVPGELHVGGSGLALGYWQRSELTVEKFIPHPFSNQAGVKIYKTGDLARYLPSGDIEYLGRIDQQVKIRGFRVELGEVESAISQHPKVSQVVVTDREDISGNRQLIAYVVTPSDEDVSSTEIRDYLHDRLPNYMLPAVVICLIELPLTPNGKVNRKALPVPSLADLHSEEYVPPRNDIEKVLASLWTEILGIERIGVHDNFFTLGGHSLLATQVVSRIFQVIGVTIPLKTLFEASSIDALAIQVQKYQTSQESIGLMPLQLADRKGRLPLSFAQQRLWFINQLEPNSTAYNMPAAVKLQGQLDLLAMEKTLKEIVRRHEALRTNFINQDGQAAQVIKDSNSWQMSTINLQQMLDIQKEVKIMELAEIEAVKPFDLTTDYLVRATILLVSENECILLLTMHHIVSDGWSMGVFVKEINILYSAFARGETSPLPDLEIQYVDFAIWQQQYLQGDRLDQQLKYWHKQLAGAPTSIELPTDRSRPAVQTFKGATQSFSLSADLTSSLNTLSQREGVTLFMTLLTAFNVLLFRYSDQTDICVGSGIANRHHGQLENLIGFFVNMLVLRTDLSGYPSFKELLGKVKDTALSAYAHQDLPFEMLVDALQPDRDLSYSPLFQVAFVLQNAPSSEDQLTGLKMSELETENNTAKFDLTLSIEQSGGKIIGSWEYSTDLFDDETIARMAGHFQTLLMGIVVDSECRITDLPLLTPYEQNQLFVEWNSTYLEYPQDKCIHQLFEEQVQKTPEAIAIVFADQQLTYFELNARANQLANHLVELGVKPGVLVGICLDRSLEIIIGLLGVLKAGGAYVPLDPTYPSARLQFMLSDSQLEVLLTQQHNLVESPNQQAIIVCLDENWRGISQQNPQNLSVRVTSADLAYVIYTSGSTGTPKGVMVRHQGLCNLATAQVGLFDIKSTSKILQFASLSFDASVWEIVMSITSGATLYIDKKEVLLPGNDLLHYLQKHQITHVTLPPTALAVMPAGLLPHLQTIVVAGEACPQELIAQWSTGRSFFNAYGPTEGTVCATVSEPLDGSKSPPIGRPIQNVEIYILDEQLQTVPIGIPGELHIGGAGIALGYLNQPELTAKKFISHPYSDDSSTRLYKTGDAARYLPDGNIEYLGRIDNQVKIRGFRIELEEIEALLNQHPAVQQTTVVLREDHPNDQRLVAYVVAEHSILNQVSLQTNQWQDEHVADWQNIYEQSYQKLSVDQGLTFNIAGWNSSYTGLPLPALEMQEWVDCIVQQILNLQPQRVLEIGCGSGLILSRIAPHCIEYCGTDYSRAALQYIEQVKQRVTGLENVTTLERMADDFQGINPDTFDTIIINSVVQYFPSVTYLLNVLEQAVENVKAGGHIVIGDIRNLSLLNAYILSVQLHQSSDNLALSHLKQNVQQHFTQEEELLIDPEFFIALQQHLPRITNVYIRPKNGAFHNELTKFRYEVILEIEGSGTSDSSAGVREWLDWQENPLSIDDIRKLLVSNQPESWGISCIANKRIQTETQACKLLHDSSTIETVQDLRQVIDASNKLGIDPAELWKTSLDSKYILEISWLNSYPDGCYDAVFRLPSTSTKIVSTKTQFKPWDAYTNDPLQGKLAKNLIPELRQSLVDKLPNYMIPGAFVLLEKMPLTANGKIDRRQLPTPEISREHLVVGFVAPRNLIEEGLMQIWKELLGIPKIGIHDNFFALGGHSLLGTQLVSRIRGRDVFDIEIPLHSLFEAPTIAELAQYIQQQLQNQEITVSLANISEKSDNNYEEISI
jgi:amino acid adenylation domain-containing protein